MAHRDKSQGFGFVYADIKTLLSQRDELKKLDNWEPIEVSQEAEVVNLNKDQMGEAAVPAITPIADTTSVDQIKENLDRLAKLHQKLHVMLDEINRMSTKKSSDN